MGTWNAVVRSWVQLKPSAELTAYRLVQEAFTNIAKYAQARHVQVRLAANGRTVEVSVRDDGCGFDPGRREPSSHGLLGMRYRVEAEGGRFWLESAPGRGTSIRASLPSLA